MLALVSEFNCFLRSRCSMEMWCPDDIGRDSWDWVGPPAWVRACFNSPEWGGGSSPVKTEPHQIVLLLLLLFWTRAEARRMCMSTDAFLIGMGTMSMSTTSYELLSTAKNSSPSRAPKNWRSTPGQPGGARKKAKKAEKPVKPPGRHKHHHTARRNNVQISSANQAWTSE